MVALCSGQHISGDLVVKSKAAFCGNALPFFEICFVVLIIEIKGRLNDYT